VKRGVVTVMGLVALLALASAPARGEVEGTGSFCLGELGLCAGIEAKPAPESERPRGPSRRRGPSPLYWLRTEFFSNTCTGSPDGYGIRYTLIDRATGDVFASRGGCLEPVAGRALPDMPPLPEEAWEQVPLPVPEVRVNPPAGGLTGLDTWFWYDQPTTARLDVDLGGFTVTIDAQAVGFRWRPGDGAELTSGTAGTPENPSASHVYETKGDYTLAVDVTWTGTYTFSGPGLEPVTVPLGERTFTGQAPFPVAEIRGVRR
jgi:hypothetical protein